MSELIDRDELKKHLMDMTRLRTNSEIGEPTCGLTRRTVFHMSEIMKVVIDMPTIEERKTGKWIKGKCSNCGAHAPFWPMASTYYESDFCPNCGADMRKTT